jgi:choline-phosphate cytidylyltransferase/glycerol-3-phosphate cytidylyltransferase
MKVITFGTFDLYHVGHVRLIKGCSLYGEVIVGLSSDEFNIKKKGRTPVYDYESRKEILESNKHVTKVFKEDSMEKKREYILEHGADILIMGSDWEGKFDEFKDICQVIYLTRTPEVSTTGTISICKTSI